MSRSHRIPIDEEEGVFALGRDGGDEGLDHAGAVHHRTGRGEIAARVANLGAGAAADLALEDDVVDAEFTEVNDSKS